MKKSIRNILALSLAAAAALTAAACGASGSPAAETEAVPAAETVSFTASDYSAVDYSGVMTLGEHSGLEIEVPPAADLDELVQGNIEYILSGQSATVMVAEGVTAAGDTILLNYTGLLDGEPFEGGTAEGTTYRIGSGYFIPDLDRQLEGLTVGETYELPCTFPDDYHNADLAGKDVVFEVTVTAIAGASNTPEWTDEFVEEFTHGEYTTTADFEVRIREELEARVAETQQEQYRNALWQAVLDRCEFTEIPQERVEAATAYYVDALTGYYQMQAYSYGMDMETFFQSSGMTEEALNAEAARMAEDEVRNFMTANMICLEEGIELTPEAYSAMIREKFEESVYNDFETFVESSGGERYTVDSCLYTLALEWLEEHNTPVTAEGNGVAADEH